MAGPRHITRPHWRRATAITLLAVAVCLAWSGGGVDFAAATNKFGDRTGRASLVARQALKYDFVEYGEAKTEADMWEQGVYPMDQMYRVTTDGAYLVEFYKGARDFYSVFWGIVQPAAAFGFLVVGASVYAGFNLVDTNPVTAYFLPFLKITDDMAPFPQGFFMSFYGFFGTFLFAPLQWWLFGANKGVGLTEFSKITKRMTKIIDNELLEDIPFSEIDKVKLDWSDRFLLGRREVFIVLKSGQEVYFQGAEIDMLSRPVLERRASTLAEFLDVELEINAS